MTERGNNFHQTSLIAKLTDCFATTKNIIVTIQYKIFPGRNLKISSSKGLKIDGVQKLGGSSAGRNICQGAELGCAELRRRRGLFAFVI